MAGKVFLRQAAVEDLDAVATYSMENFGAAQAGRYRAGFLKVFDLLAAFPMIGLEVEAPTGLRRYVHASHAIYYRVIGDEIVVSRILGPGQDPTREFDE